MYGAIYGDLVGSVYEYLEFIKHDKERMIKASNEADLIKEESFISDDSLLTLAVIDAIKNNLGYEETLRRYILENSEPLNKDNYFEYMFSQNNIDWALGKTQGLSTGNGAMMRVSPIPNMRETYISICNDVIALTGITHNTKEAMLSALCIANMIYLGINNYPKDKIKKIVDTYYPCNYDFKLAELRDNMHFNRTCSETLPIVLYAIFNTSNFDDAIRLTLSLGGDTDTNCCIVGSVAESLYGMNSSQKKLVLDHLDDRYKELLKSAY